MTSTLEPVCDEVCHEDHVTLIQARELWRYWSQYARRPASPHLKADRAIQ